MPLCNICSTTPFHSLPKPDVETYQFLRAGEWAFRWPMITTSLQGKPKLPEDFGFPWIADLKTLRRSAASCTLCSLVQTAVDEWFERYIDMATTDEAFKQNHLANMPFPKGQRLFLVRRAMDAPGFIVFVRNPKETTEEQKLYQLGIIGWTLPNDSKWKHLFPRPIASDSSSTETWDVVESWLNDCQTKHEKCDHGEAELPSRVLDISSKDNTIKLIDGNKRMAKYACLSYCWGNVVNYKTTKDSIASRKAGFEISELPKTLQDSVIIARRLQLKYLWIDSLCICQDDADEWARECPRMSSVYFNAYISIAANHAQDVSVGCFNIREPLVSCPTFSSTLLTDKNEEIQVQAQILPWTAEAYGEQAFSWEPLSKRGWALQERILAKRVLHFNSGQLYYECNHGTVAEDGWNFVVRMVNLHALMNKKNQKNERNGSQDEPQDESQNGPKNESENKFVFGSTKPQESDYESAFEYEFDLTWAWAATYFGSRLLTRSSDKLPALSGLANLFEQQLDTTYVAGLWSHNLIKGLLWTSHRGGRVVSSDVQDVRPSWSWISYEGVTWSVTNARTMYNIAKAEAWHVQPLNVLNPYGQVVDAWIRIRGPMVTLQKFTGDITKPAHRYCNCASHTTASRVITPYTEDKEGHVCSLERDEEEDKEEDQERSDSVLHLLILARKIDEEPRAGESFCLILKKVPNDQGLERMERIGWFSLDQATSRLIEADEENWKTVTLV